MKNIKVKKCRTCPHILYDDGKGFTSAFWKCGEFNIMLIDQETGIHNNLDEIHAQCKLDEYADTGELIRQVNDILDKHIAEANYWAKHEGFAGNTDKESWWEGAKTQAVKFKAILNNELTNTFLLFLNHAEKPPPIDKELFYYIYLQQPTFQERLNGHRGNNT